MTEAVAIVSGGMDSVTLAYHLKHLGFRLTLLSVDYGQRHAKEMQYAAECADTLGAEHHIVDLTSVTDLLKGCSLTDRTVEVPDGHYAAETMKKTVVPNRNAMMLDVATAIAVAQGAEIVATGVHAGDHFIYPDCRPDFLAAYDQMIRVANEGFGNPLLHLVAPFMLMSKAQIALIGKERWVPYERTWSCYKGGEIHCGSCGTCFERREALAPIGDPTEYLATPDYIAPDEAGPLVEGDIIRAAVPES